MIFKLDGVNHKKIKKRLKWKKREENIKIIITVGEK